MRTIEEKDAYFWGGLNAVKSIKRSIETQLGVRPQIGREELLMVLDAFEEDIASLKAAQCIAEMKHED